MSLCRPVFTALILLLLLNGCSQGSESSSVELGLPCNLGSDAGMSQAAYKPQAPECSAGLCLKPASESYEDRGTAPYCTIPCSTDSDCHGQKRDGHDPNDHRCTQGYSCGVAFTVGPLCCQKVCLCRDFLSPRGVTTPPNCKSGTDGRDGCGGV